MNSTLHSNEIDVYDDEQIRLLRRQAYERGFRMHVLDFSKKQIERQRIMEQEKTVEFNDNPRMCCKCNERRSKETGRIRYYKERNEYICKRCTVEHQKSIKV